MVSPAGPWSPHLAGSRHRASRNRRIRGVRTYLALVAIGVLVSGCDAVLVPDTSDGRSTGDDRPVELFVVHGLAETLSAVAIDAPTGGLTAVDENIRLLGAVPNAIAPGDQNSELLVTISGENRVLVLDESTLTLRDTVVFDPGTNPMESFALGAIVPEASGLLVTTSLFNNTLILSNRGSDSTDATEWSVAGVDDAQSLPLHLPVGQAPQALIVRPASETGTVRVIVANTAYSTSRPASAPFGVASLTEYRITVVPPPAATLTVTPVHDAYAFGSVDSTGLNPTSLLFVPGAGSQRAQILVIGSGRNYAPGDDSATDDGRVLVLDAETLDVVGDLRVGGSPGAAAVHRTGEGHRVLLAGPGGIRMIERSDASGWTSTDSGAPLVYRTDGDTLSLIADLTIYDTGTGTGSYVYATDYWSNHLLLFSINQNGVLSLQDRRDLPQGPQALLLVDES